MIIIDCDQRDETWFRHRAGIPTTSRFGSIITPSGQRSKSPAYVRDLLAEWLAGKSLDDYQSKFMADGTEREETAQAWYEFQCDVEIQHVGLILTDDRLAGCSPDGLIGEAGGLEGKAPGHRKHMETLLAQAMPPEHKPQVQGGLAITGRDWWDFMSWHPDLPPFLVRIERDEPYIRNCLQYLADFNGELEKEKQRLRELGYTSPLENAT